jgi:hypothetical protein
MFIHFVDRKYEKFVVWRISNKFRVECETDVGDCEKRPSASSVTATLCCSEDEWANEP